MSVAGRASTTSPADQGAELIVFGSPERGPLGRVLLGNAAAAASRRSALRGRGRAARLPRHPAALEPPMVGVAFDGSAESAAAVDAALTLARAGGAALRMVAVEPAGWSRPLRHHEPVAPALALLAAELEDGLEVETRRARGRPGPRARPRDRGARPARLRLPRTRPAGAA